MTAMKFGRCASQSNTRVCMRWDG